MEEEKKTVSWLRKPFVLLFLFVFVCCGTVWGSFFLFSRVRNAHEVVQEKYRGQEKALLAIIRETLSEAIKGSKLPKRRHVVISSDVATYDEATVERLAEEGIEIEDVNAIRIAMRQVFNDPDPEVRAKAAAVLYEKHGVKADQDLLKELEKVQKGETSTTMKLAGGMKRAAKSIAASLRKVYDDLGKM